MTKGISYEIQQVDGTINSEMTKTKLFIEGAENAYERDEDKISEEVRNLFNGDNLKAKLLLYDYQNPDATDETVNCEGSTKKVNLHNDDKQHRKQGRIRVVIITLIIIGSVAAFLLSTHFLFFIYKDIIPEWQRDNFMIETIPGLRYRPKPPAAYAKGTLIAFNGTNEKDYRIWTDIIENFLKAYRVPRYRQQLYSCDYDRPSYGDKVCYVDVKNWFPCVPENNFNYHRNSPCIFIKFNEIPNWTPEYYNDTRHLPENMPNDLKEYIKIQESHNPLLLNTVWVSCEGENPADKEFITSIRYIPQRGFPGYFFPYINKKGYLSPLVAVQFEKIATGVLVNVECRLWAPNIVYNREKGRGLVHFELMID